MKKPKKSKQPKKYRKDTVIKKLQKKASFIIDSQTGGTQISSNPSRREADLYMLSKLPKIPQILGPKFIYAHMMLPHPPFVFGRNGEEVTIGISGDGLNDVEEYQDEASRIGYRDQLLHQ